MTENNIKSSIAHYPWIVPIFIQTKLNHFSVTLLPIQYKVSNYPLSQGCYFKSRIISIWTHTNKLSSCAVNWLCKDNQWPVASKKILSWMWAGMHINYKTVSSFKESNITVSIWKTLVSNSDRKNSFSSFKKFLEKMGLTEIYQYFCSPSTLTLSKYHKGSSIDCIPLDSLCLLKTMYTKCKYILYTRKYELVIIIVHDDTIFQKVFWLKTHMTSS